ncbi:transporter substrate-binding domain-containing protein [Roseateles cavernae]|uniref:transporter substrate-binding domain-containing protein n=1 Tax=Roseateles cavernae TaxID=3153578 RepID=UPI0032E3BC37
MSLSLIQGGGCIASTLTKVLPWLMGGYVLLPGALSAAESAPSLHGATSPNREAVRFAVEKDYPPFVFEADGRPQGLSVEVLALIAQRVNLQISPQPARTLPAALLAVKQGEADLISSVRSTTERASYLLFTEPYVRVPAVVVSKDSARSALAALSGRSVAVSRGYAVEAHVRLRAPQVNWVPVDDDATALKGVAEGRYDAAVADIASIDHHAPRLSMPSLTIGEPVGFEYALSFAVRMDQARLRDKLDEGLRRLTQEERQSMRQRWLPSSGLVPSAALMPIGAMLGLGFLMVALLLGVAVWWRGRAHRSQHDGGAAT